MATAEEIAASKLVWDAYERAAVLTPAVKLHLTLAECAKRYGAYQAGGKAIPIVPGHVELTNYVCEQCGQPAPGFIEYDGVLACSRDCAALLSPKHPKLAHRVEGARARAATRAEIAALAERLVALKAELGVA